MTKSALAVALLALTGTALVAPPLAVAASPLDPPAVTIAGGDLTVSELQSYTVSDIHPSARSISVTYAGQPVTSPEIVEAPAGVLTATGEFETWGMAGENHLVVAQCSDLAATVCGAPTTVTTTVDNPVPTHELSRSGTQFAAPFDLTMHLVHSTGSPRIRLVTDGGTPEYVDPEVATTIATAGLLDGAHTIEVAVCAADESPCVTSGSPVSFDLVRSVPGTFSLSAPGLSPNADLKFDTLVFSYTQQVDWDAAAVELRDSAGTVVYSGAVPLPVAPSNDGTFVYDGSDGLGGVLPDGSYSARLSVSRTLDSGDTASSTYGPRSFTVDTTAQAPPALTTSVTTFYPYVDGYRDTVKLAYAGQEQYSRVDFVVRNAANTVVRTKQVLVAADAAWNGRNNAGSRVPAGKYTLLIRTVDVLGNIGFSPAAMVTVSDKKLVTVTKVVTVTPKASLVRGVTGACSTRRTPSLHGWAGSTGYLSNTRCRTTFKASRVWTHNRIHLPDAVTYRWVRLGWYGGPTKAATRDRAIATLYGTDNSAQGWFSSVDYLAAQYIPSVKGSRVVDDGDVSWGFQTDRGNRYDVKSFNITYRADVLR